MVFQSDLFSLTILETYSIGLYDNSTPYKNMYLISSNLFHDNSTLV